MGNDECCNVAVVETQLIASLRWGGKMLKPNTQYPKPQNKKSINKKNKHYEHYEFYQQ